LRLSAALYVTMVSTLRLRTRKVKPDSYASDQQNLWTPARDTHESIAGYNKADDDLSSPPVYTIDLSLPPQERYVKLAKDNHRVLLALPILFDDLCAQAPIPLHRIHFLARLFLRRLYSAEQTKELKGISQTIKLPLYLLVAYNVLLDLLMGCTSGGALVRPPETKEPRMMHFRNLDWNMPELRKALVQYDFVERPGGKVIASTISYVGFVGVLTGVREGLSVSLNFRAHHNDDASLLSNARFYATQLSVLLGFRSSIASRLRDFIVPRRTTTSELVDQRPKYGQADICGTLPGLRTTAAYLIFCTGAETIVLEKDHKTAKILTATDFIAVTNHDSVDTVGAHASNAGSAVGMQDLVEDSVERKECMVKRYAAWRQTSRTKGKKQGVPLEELKKWVLAYPTCNEQTHFVCVMDPQMGAMRWVRGFEEGEVLEDEQSGVLITVRLDEG
jgi:hypothetical protein